jgi:hypothetical protein
MSASAGCGHDPEKRRSVGRWCPFFTHDTCDKVMVINATPLVSPHRLATLRNASPQSYPVLRASLVRRGQHAIPRLSGRLDYVRPLRNSLALTLGRSYTRCLDRFGLSTTRLSAAASADRMRPCKLSHSVRQNSASCSASANLASTVPSAGGGPGFV